MSVKLYCSGCGACLTEHDPHKPDCPYNPPVDNPGDDD